MARMTGLGAWLASLGRFGPPLTFGRERICGRRATGAGGVSLQAGFEAIDLRQESEALVPPAGRRLAPIRSWDAESLRQGCGIKQKQVTHGAVSSCLVSIISITQWMARQQKRVGSGIIHTLSTP